jgi:AcrR family transcriptional regulator
VGGGGRTGAGQVILGAMASSLPAPPPGSGGAGVAGARTEDIRRTAARLFERRGYAATTISDIAEAAGILPGSLYHHFASKEDIAVDLLTSYSRALAELGAVAARPAVAGGRAEVTGAGGVAGAGRTAGAGGTTGAGGVSGANRVSGAEELLRSLSGDVAALAFRHAAAVRLSAYEAPSVATGRFTAAIQFRSPALERAWRIAVQSLAGGSPVADLGLLRFTLQRVTAYAPLYYPDDRDADELAAHLCDLLLHGLLTDPPPFAELDRSAAYRTALEVTGAWGRRLDSGPEDLTGTILAAARSEFARRGYEATTIRDIAGVAGVGMATLYRRVDSKEALLRTIVDVYADRLDEAFGAVLAAGSSDTEQLYAIMRVFAHASRHFREESQIVVFGWPGREAASSPVHEYFVATQRRLDTLAALLRRGLDAGTTRPIAGPAELADHVRTVLWLRFHSHARASEPRTFEFLRQSLLCGALAREPG